MSKTCDKCGQDWPAKPLRDRYGIPIKIEHVMLYLDPEIKRHPDDYYKCIIEIKPSILILDRIEWNIRDGKFVIEGRDYRRANDFQLVGFSDEPVKELISLNITLNEFIKGEVSLA